MKESTRTLALFVVIVVAGSVMVVFDLPLFYLLVGMVALLILVLILSGALRIPRITRNARNREGEAAKPPAPAPQVREAPARETGTPKKKRGPAAGGFFSEFAGSIKGAFRILARDIRSQKKPAKEKETQKKKIDEMLDRSVAGAAITSLDDVIPELAPVTRQSSSDPFSDLASESLKDDLLNSITSDDDSPLLFDNVSLGGAVTPGGEPVSPEGIDDIGKLDIALDEHEEQISIDEDEDDEVKDILDAYKDDLDMPAGEMPILPQNLEGMDGIDLGEIDLDAELGEQGTGGLAIPPASSPKTPGTPARKTPSPAGEMPAQPAKSSEMDMISFGTGVRQDDDLMASLKSEAKGVKKQEHASLLRDLKDVHVPAADLEKELEGLLKARKQKG